MAEFNELRTFAFEEPHTPFPELSIEVMGPNPDETFAAPMQEPPEWVARMVAKRQTQTEQE